MSQECKTAIIKFGNDNNNGFVIIQGNPLPGEGTITYWYPDDLTKEEANQEIIDLCEYYENVVIILPIPDQVQFEVLTQWTKRLS